MHQCHLVRHRVAMQVHHRDGVVHGQRQQVRHGIVPRVQVRQRGAGGDTIQVPQPAARHVQHSQVAQACAQVSQRCQHRVRQHQLHQRGQRVTYQRHRRLPGVYPQRQPRHRGPRHALPNHRRLQLECVGGGAGTPLVGATSSGGADVPVWPPTRWSSAAGHLRRTPPRCSRANPLPPSRPALLDGYWRSAGSWLDGW